MVHQLILASASPRRREILEQAGIPFRVQVADFDEGKVREELAARGQQGAENDDGSEAGDDFPARYVKALALGKVQAVMQENVNIRKNVDIREDADEEGLVVLGADTVVVHRGEILNKPVDREDAKRMLTRLQGDVHAVYTGVALCRGKDGKLPQGFLPQELRGVGQAAGKNPEEKMELIRPYAENGAEQDYICENFAVRTEVVFYPMDEEEIEEYLACGEYADKAGAYAIQGKMAAYIKEIHGDYYNVVGLPLSAVVQALKKM